MVIRLTVNEIPREVSCSPSILLVHLLREELGLTGTHVGCDTTNCGACAVLLEGKAVKSCTVLAGQVQDRAVRTVEGLMHDGRLGVVQQAFANCHALQCGFCTSGFLIVATALLKEKPSLDEDDVRHALAGNLCRCTGYQHIVDAVLAAAREEASR